MTVITWSEFPQIKESVKGQESAIVVSEMFLPPTYADKRKNYGHYARIGVNIAVLTGVFLLFNEIDVFAAESLNDKAEKAYAKFIDVARWIVALKGAWDTVHKMLKEDFDGAKKSFLQYLIIFAILIGLPKALELVESFFSDL